MRQISGESTIFRPTALIQLAFTAATTGIITANSNGLAEGDCVHVATDNALPSGLTAATNYYVIEPATNTFKLSATRGGPAVTIANTGTGTHTYTLKGKAIWIGDWQHNVIHLTFSGTPAMTVKFQGSMSTDAPDFNAAQSVTNKWDVIDVIDSEDGASIDGDTGVACAGTADNRIFELNVNGLNWVTVVFSSWSDGELGVTIQSYND